MDSRTYRFQLTVTIDGDHPSADDPEWFADAAWGALTNLYGIECTYGEIVEVEVQTPGTS